MKRKPSPPAKDIRAPWQIAQAAFCGCRGTDDMCACQNVDQSDPAQRYLSRADLEQRIREFEGTVRTLELQQQTDRQTIASLSAARPAVVSDEVVDAAYDKNGREIMQGDVLKVFHFVGSRRKRHYMYKQVVGERLLGQRQAAYWFVSHLEQNDEGYHLAKDGTVYWECEIVQSLDARFEDRPRHTPTQKDPHHGR